MSIKWHNKSTHLTGLFIHVAIINRIQGNRNLSSLNSAENPVRKSIFQVQHTAWFTGGLVICLTMFLFYHVTALKTRRAANLGSVNVNRKKVPANHGCEAQGSAVLCWDSEGLQGEPSHIRASVPVAVETIHSLLQHQSGKIMYRDAELCVCHTHTHTS